jgi:uncharacterized protein (UPF0335 family)
LNKKVNNNSEIMDENKKMLLNKIARLEQEMINKQFGDGNPLKFNFNAHEETLKRMEEEIEALQNDYYVFKEKLDK